MSDFNGSENWPRQKCPQSLPCHESFLPRRWRSIARLSMLAWGHFILHEAHNFANVLPSSSLWRHKCAHKLCMYVFAKLCPDARLYSFPLQK